MVFISIGAAIMLALLFLLTKSLRADIVVVTGNMPKWQI